MGNAASTAAKTSPASASGTPTPPASGQDTPRQHPSRRDPRSSGGGGGGGTGSGSSSLSSGHFVPHHGPHRSNAAPPEPSLAQAQGSTIVSRPKSVPSSAVSSLSGSPLAAAPGPHRIAAAADGSRTAARDEPYEPSKPVDVPGESSSLRSHHSGHHHSSAAYHPHAHDLADVAGAETHLVSNGSVTDMYLTRPPRLPLPIEEEVHTPGSPILAPEEGLPEVEPEAGGSSDGLARKTSALSAVDEDESEELRVDKTRPVVPTKLEWKRGGDKVYVTGTIFQWNRKHRLHPVEGKPGCYSATIHILPGTHHVRFLVDGVMQTSPDLPTTVDFGNNLVNYIEVNPDDIPQRAAAAAAAAAAKAKAEGEPPAADAQESSVAATPQDKDGAPSPKATAVLPVKSYHGEIPKYLLDFDQAEDSPAYQNAVAAIEKLPTPPSLPGFLGKPILNAATLMKDDNSVLNMPNHTVLNHLATSSIKNNTLAVSATTRYRSKYVTTIIYKPTTTEDA